ncbi:MAG: copper resistance protein CopC [Bacteroidota bacterium]
MRNTHSKFTYLMILAMGALSFVACEEEELDTENPKIVWNQPQFGEAIADSEDIIVDFSDNVALKAADYQVLDQAGSQVLEISMDLSGTSGNIIWKNNGGKLTAGTYTISATVTDEAGNTNTGSNQFSVN